MNNQLDLFPPSARDAPVPPIGAAAVTPELHELARRLPPDIHLGTSSWYFPGWAGIVFDRKASKQIVTREGLHAYGHHALLRTVGIDRTFYAPLPATEFARYAGQVPEHFRFLVKAPSIFVTPRLRDGCGYSGGDNPNFLDAAGTVEKFITPVSEGLGPKTGPLLFQFSPMGKAIANAPKQFAQSLIRFFCALPKGPLYAVELRDAALFTQDYVDGLRAAGVVHCISVHPRMPDVATQVQLALPSADAPLIVRWNLHSGFKYEAAKDRYAPFDRLVDEDSDTRAALARLCARTHRAGLSSYVIINNKAEDSAPLSVFKLTAAIVDDLSTHPSRI